MELFLKDRFEGVDFTKDQLMTYHANCPGPKVIKLFSFSTEHGIYHAYKS